MYAVTGDLTIKGVTREITVEATVQGTGEDPWGNERAGIAVRGSIDRTDFGLTWQSRLAGGGLLVGDVARLSPGPLGCRLVIRSAAVASTETSINLAVPRGFPPPWTSGTYAATRDLSPRGAAYSEKVGRPVNSSGRSGHGSARTTP